MSKTREALKPCPFCNSRNVDPEGWKSSDGRTGPACDDCCGSADSIVQWNTRPRETVSPLPLAGDVEGLCAKLLRVEPCDLGPFLDDDTGPFERQRGERFVNPDGLAAATLIRSLVGRVEAAERDALEAYTKDENGDSVTWQELYEAERAALATERRAKEEAERERDNARSDNAWLSKRLLHERSLLSSIAQDVEDEGGRVYFGRTSDADALKGFVEEIENYDFDRITRESKWPDYIETLRAAHERLAAAETCSAALARTLERIANTKLGPDTLTAPDYEAKLLQGIARDALEANH